MPDHSIQPTDPRVLVVQWIQPGCYICISGQLSNPDLVGSRWYSGHHEHHTQFDWEPKSKVCFSFNYVQDGVAAEWDGEYGPVQLWFRQEAGVKDARPHWLWPFADGTGHWSQLAVNRAKLKEKFNRGDYAAIFDELRQWVQTNLERKANG